VAQSKKLNAKLVHPAKAKSKAEASPKKARGSTARKSAKNITKNIPDSPSGASPEKAVSSNESDNSTNQPERKLTLKQEKYIEAYLRTGNATQAAREAGYEGDTQGLANIGYQNYRKLYIRQRIEDRIAEARIDTDEILGVLRSQLHGSIEDCFEFSDYGQPTLNLNLARARGVLHLIKELSFDQWGRPKVKMYDAKSAADTLARISGLDKSGQASLTITFEQLERALQDEGLI
jgi:hypothetical protein